MLDIKKSLFLWMIEVARNENNIEAKWTISDKGTITKGTYQTFLN